MRKKEKRRLKAGNTTLWVYRGRRDEKTRDDKPLSQEKKAEPKS